MFLRFENEGQGYVKVKTRVLEFKPIITGYLYLAYILEIAYECQIQCMDHWQYGQGNL